MLAVADRLLELEREGLISKRIYPETRPKVEYLLTPQARELEGVLKEQQSGLLMEGSTNTRGCCKKGSIYIYVSYIT